MEIIAILKVLREKKIFLDFIYKYFSKYFYRMTKDDKIQLYNLKNRLIVETYCLSKELSHQKRGIDK